MRPNDARISVVMITHNRREEVLRSLASFFELPERPAIVVVDNGSSDGTAAAIAESFPTVRLIRSRTNLGAMARNLGIERAATPYLALADDDTTWEPGSLSRAADLLDAHPELGVIVARVLVGRGNVEDPICRILADSPLPRQEGMPGPSLLGFLAGASAVRRSALLEAGGFRPWMFLGGEEELLAADLAALGWWLCYVPQLVVHHYPSAIRDSSTRRVFSLRNALWFAWLRRPLRLALRRTVALARTALNDRLACRALCRALVGLPRLLLERRAVPAELERQFIILDCDSSAGGSPKADIAPA